MSDREERLTALLGRHRPIEDSRGDVKSCACGVLFGVQHQENGSHPSHQAAVLSDWLAAHDEAIRAEERERIAVAIEAGRHDPPADVVNVMVGYTPAQQEVLAAMWHLGMDGAAAIARTTEVKP
jgi:hypothetical protein